MSRKARKNVGVIGLGIIGSRVAAGLRSSGYQVYVWNRSPKPAPNFLGSPAEVAESAEIIQIFVADAQALFDVVEAMSEALTPKHVIVCNATVGPEAVLEAAQLVEARGAQFLDAPFTGSKVAAEKKQLVYYVGGQEAAFVRVRPILELSSKTIIRMGEIGHASTIKVVTNMISAVTIQVLAESLSIVQKAGLEPELLTAAIEQNACRSGVIDLKLPKMMSGDYEPHFSLKHMFKDVQLGIHMANALDIEVPATTVTAGVMYGALNQGWGDLDFSVLFKNYTPNEIFEALPALEQALNQSGAAAESPPPAAEPLSLPGASMTSTFEASSYPEPAAEPPPEPLEIPTPIIPSPVIPATLSADTTAFSSNGGSVNETVPTEEAARIIEAVLTHVAGQRGDVGSLPTTARVTPAAGSATVAKPEPIAEPEPFSEITAVPVTAVPADAVSVNAPDEAGSTDDDGKGGRKPQNFVSRWFVGKTRG